MICRGEEPVEEKAEVGRLYGTTWLQIVIGIGTITEEQLVKQCGAGLFVARRVAGRVILEEGLVQEVEVARVLGQ